jgi:Protein of unknown function (DUF2905)
MLGPRTSDRTGSFHGQRRSQVGEGQALAEVVRETAAAQEEPETPGQARRLIVRFPAGPGPLLVGIGVALVLVGLLAWSGLLGWFGRLPGDIRIERGSVHLYVPIVSMLLVSAVLTVILQLIRRL